MRGFLLRRKKIWLLGGALIALVLSIGGFLIYKRTQGASAANDDPIFTIPATIRSDGKDTQYAYSGMAFTHYFRLEGAGINTAWCAQANKSTPPLNSGTTVAVYDVNNASDSFKTWFKILYYSNERYIGHDGIAFSNAEIHQALSRTYAATGNTGYSELDARARDIINQVSTKPLPAGTNYLYVAYNGNNVQTLMTYYHWDVQYVDLDVTKTWEDDGNQYHTRPDSIKVHLYKNGSDTGQYKTLSASNNWTASFDKLTDDGEYSTVEDEPTNYKGNTNCSQDGNRNWHCVITNSLTKEYISLPVVKKWLDGGDSSARPDNIKVYLVINGTKSDKFVNLNSSNGWSSSFTNLEKGPTYTVSEGDVSGYDGSIAFVNGRWVLTNTRTGTRTIEVTKVWDDHGDEDGRPEYVTVTITGGGNTYTETIRPADDEDKANPNTWKVSFGGYPKYDNQGVEINYSVTETLPDGTEYEIDSISGNMNDGFTVKNKKDEKTRLIVYKHWVDNNNRLMQRPESISIDIMKNGQYFRTITMTSANQHVITPEEHARYDDNREIMEELMNRWDYLIEDLPKYDENDNLINYTISEQTVVGYDGSKIICNDFDGVYGNDVCAVYNVRKGDISLTVNKTWNDGDNQDGFRPNVITFSVVQIYYSHITGNRLTRNYGVIRLYAEDNWEPKSLTVPGFDGYGVAYEYFVAEMPSGPYESHEVTSCDQDDEDCIASYIDEYGNYHVYFENTPSISTGVNMIKCWNDGDGSARPDSIPFTLTTYLQDKDTGEKTLVESRDVAVTGEKTDNCWYESISNLPLFDDDGNRYRYVVEEDESWMEGTDYETRDEACDAEDNSWNCRYYNYLDGRVTVDGTKTWKDNEDANHLRPAPEAVELVLYRMSETEDEEAVMYVEPTWTQNDDKTWTYTFADLPKYDDYGYEYGYRVEEKSTPIELANGDRYVSADTAAINNFTNVLTGNVDYCGKKVWRDGNAPEGFRPEEIVVTLTRDDGETYSTTVSAASSEDALVLCDETVEEEGEVWYFVFEDLDKYDDEGRQYEYTLSESGDIDNYVTTVAQSKNIIYNDYEEKPIHLTVNKIWLNDKPEDRPDYIEVTLYRNGHEYEKRRLSDKTGWTYTWNNLDGNFEWSVTESIHIENYGTEIRREVDGNGNIVYNIYNTKAPETSNKSIARYVFMTGGILLGGLFVSRRFLARR